MKFGRIADHRNAKDPDYNFRLQAFSTVDTALALLARTPSTLARWPLPKVACNRRTFNLLSLSTLRERVFGRRCVVLTRTLMRTASPSHLAESVRLVGGVGAWMLAAQFLLPIYFLFCTIPFWQPKGRALL